MKRERDNDDKPPPNRTFRESPFSKPYNNVATSNNSYSNGSSNKDEHDHFLPIANVGRIMKKIVPGNGKISKEAKEAVQKCVSEFISFVTGEASDKCRREKRKTINGEDILWAIMMLEFQNYVSPLKLFLNKFREIEVERLPKQQGLEPCYRNNEKNNFTYYNNNNNVYLSVNNMNAGDSMASPLPRLQNHLEEHW